MTGRKQQHGYNKVDVRPNREVSVEVVIDGSQESLSAVQVFMDFENDTPARFRQQEGIVHIVGKAGNCSVAAYKVICRK